MTFAIKAFNFKYNKEIFVYQNFIQIELLMTVIEYMW